MPGAQSTEPPAFRRRIFEVASQAWSESTRQTYGSGLLLYHVFCDVNSIQESDRAPARAGLISAFVAGLAGQYSVSCISNYLAGLAAWHTLHGLAWAIDERELAALLRGAARLAPAPKKQRAPLTVDVLSRILCVLDISNSLDVAFAAALTTCFWGTARVNEVTVPRLDAFRTQSHVTAACVSHRTDASGNAVTVIHVPSTKCDPLNGEDIFWASQPGPADPAVALQRQRVHNSPDATTHLFSYTDRSGKRVPMTRSNFLKRLKTAAAAAGVELPAGHSIRIGSTTEYLLRGVPFDVMRAKGRWKSDAFLLYLRKHAEIMAPYIQANPDVFDALNRMILPRAPPVR